MKNQNLALFVLILLFACSMSIKVKINVISWSNYTATFNSNTNVTVYYASTVSQNQCNDIMTGISTSTTAQPSNNDIFVINTQGAFWFAYAKPSSTRKAQTGGGLLAGIWEIRPNSNSYIVKPYGELLKPNLGSYIYGGYNVTNITGYSNMYWGLEQVVDATTTAASGQAIGISAGGIYSDNGIKIEFTGTITNQITNTQQSGTQNAWTKQVDSFSTQWDTDSTSSNATTKYILTYKIPADKPELNMDFTITPVSGTFAIAQIDFKVNLNAIITDTTKTPAATVAYEVVSAPEVMVTNNNTSLAILDVNKYFTNSCVNSLFDYEFDDTTTAFGVMTPPGRGQVACTGAPKNNISFLCFYPNNDNLPKEAYEDYALSISEQKPSATDRRLAFDYTLLKTQTMYLTPTNIGVVSMRMKFIDATPALP